MKSSKKKSVIVLFLLLVSILGYSQYQSASEISVNISENTIINEDKGNLNYEIELEFKNPSLLTLPVGETKFFIFYDNEMIGKGNLESFTLYPISNSYVKGTFTTDQKSDESKSVKISAITKYDLLGISIEIPFGYYPTDEQTRKFIQQN
jgi:LEA14-like dessication related protein